MTIIVGHRGAAGHAPENTISAFKKALDFGVDMIELDVRLSKNKIPVVIHDARLLRLAKDFKAVNRLTLEELKKIKIFGNKQIPTLSEVIDLVKNRAKINIEIKSGGAARAIADLLKKKFDAKAAKRENILISSFNWKELENFRELLPSVKIGLLLPAFPVGYKQTAKKLGAYSLHLNWRFVNKRNINEAHKGGLKVFVWTVNNAEDIVKMKSLGADAIVSDYPDRINNR